MKIILVMGLPGAGKTTLANEMAPLLNARRLNADEVRKAANDWDFSEEGRVRPVSYTHLPSPRDRSVSRMPSSA